MNYIDIVSSCPCSDVPYCVDRSAQWSQGHPNGGKPFEAFIGLGALRLSGGRLKDPVQLPGPESWGLCLCGRTFVRKVLSSYFTGFWESGRHKNQEGQLQSLSNAVLFLYFFFEVRLASLPAFPKHVGVPGPYDPHLEPRSSPTNRGKPTLRLPGGIITELHPVPERDAALRWLTSSVAV